MSHATLSLTQHTGFLTALSESGYTATEAIALTSCVEAFEQSLIGSAVSASTAPVGRHTFLQEPAINPTSSDRSLQGECGLSEFQSVSSSLFDSSLLPPLSVQNSDHESMLPELSQGGQS